MKNHYTILGLNPNGLKNDEKSRYDKSDIEKAYRNRSLKLHPDKNPDKQNEFLELKESYDVLIDSKRRATFDRILKENPGLTDQNHLFVEIDSDSNLSNASKTQGNSNELIPFKSTEVDLTKLIEDAEYTGDAILALARRSHSFAKALLDNPSTFAKLSSTQQFELLIIIQQQSNAEEFDNCLQKTTVKSLKRGMALVNLCLQQKEKKVAIQLIESLNALEKLSYKALLVLSQGFYEAVPVLLKKYPNSLDIVSLEFIFNKYPEHKKTIEKLLKEYSPKNYEHFQIYSRFKRMATEDNKTELLQAFREERSISQIKELGLDTLLVGQSLSNNILTFLYNCEVLNILLVEKTPELLNALSLQDLEKLKYTLIDILSSPTVSFNLFERGIVSLNRIPQENIFFLLSSLNNRLFFYLISKIKFENWSKTVVQEYANFFLMNAQSGSDEPLLLKGLNDLNENAWGFLENNTKVVKALLKNTYYKKALATTTNLNMQKKLTKLIVQLDIDVNILSDQEFSQYHQLILAYKKLYFYINNKEITHKLTWQEFESYYKITGFFDDLLKIRAYDFKIEFNIIFNIAKGALIEIRDNPPPSEKYWRYSRDLSTFFLNVFVKQNDDQLKELAKLCELKGVREFLLESAYYGINLFFGQKLFAEEFIAFLHFTAQCSQYTDFPIAFLEALSKIIKSDSFIKREMLQTNHLFEGIAWKDRELISEPNDEIPDDKLDEHFENICLEFKEQLRPLYPNTFFSRVLEFYDSDFYNNILKEKLDTFNTLSKFLCEIKPEPIGYPLANKTLKSLHDLILKTGIDWKVMSELKEKLQSTNPSLLSALLTLTLDDSRILRISPQEINDLLGNIKLNEPLEQTYLLLAKKYLHQYRGTVEGSVLVKIAEAHEEKIIPLFKQYGLYPKFLNGIKLKNYFAKIGQGTGQIRNQPAINIEYQPTISVKQLNQNLYNQFKTLIKDYTVADTNTDKHSHFTQMDDYYLILTENIEQHEIQDPKLQQLGTHYPHQDSDLLRWIVALAFDDNLDAKKKLKSLITNTCGNAKLKIYSTIFAHLNKSGKLEEISYKDIMFYFSDEIMPDLIIFYFKSELEKEINYIPPFILDYLEDKFMLKNSGALDEIGSANLNKIIEAYLSKENFFLNPISDKPLQWIVAAAFDNNIDEKKKLESLITNTCENTKSKIYSTIFSYLKKSKKLKNISYYKEIMLLYFSDKIMSDLIIFYFKSELEKEVDYIPPFILDYFEVKFTLEDLEELDETGSANLNKMIEAYLSKENFFPNPIEDDLKQKFASKQKTIQTFNNAERFLNHMFPKIPYNKVTDLLPLLCGNLLKSEEVNDLATDSLCYRAYKKLASQTYQADSSHIREIKNFFDSEYFKFIQVEVLNAFDAESERLKKDGGTEKANLLKTVKEEIIKESVLDGITKKGFNTSNYDAINQTIYRKILIFSWNSKIGTPRHELRAFFKKIAGVLIAGSLFTAPLFSKRYCAFFFKTTTTGTLEAMSEKVRNFNPHQR